MSTPPSSSRVEMALPDDPHAISAIAGAVDHIAQRSGLPPNQRKDLIAAAEEAVRAAFRKMTNHQSTIGVAIEEYPDRIAVIIEHAGEPWTAGGERLGTFERMDRVERQTVGGVSRLILTKHVPTPAAGGS